MLVILIILLIFVILGIIISYKCEGDLDNIWFGAIVGMLLGLIPSVFIGGIISIQLFGTIPLECSYSQNLVALKDNSSISGSFFLGYGDINSEMNYVYAVESEKGITTVTIDQDKYKVYIKYTDGQPYVEYWDAPEDLWRLSAEYPYYVFYIPNGSVINAYEIDLE